MSYGRDRDHQTRGAGAIAALDHRRARQQRLVAMARATGARDRAMASVTRGALGLVSVPEGGGGRSVPARTPPAPAPRITPGRTAPAPATTTWSQPVPAAATAPVAASAPYWGHPVTVITTNAPITPVPQPPYTAHPTQGDPSPAPAPTPTDRGVIGGGTTSGGSGGAGSGSGTGVKMGAPTQAPPVFTMPDVLDWASQPQSDHTMRNGILLAAGATLAAYLLFFRRRSG